MLEAHQWTPHNSVVMRRLRMRLVLELLQFDVDLCAIVVSGKFLALLRQLRLIISFSKLY